MWKLGWEGAKIIPKPSTKAVLILVFVEVRLGVNRTELEGLTVAQVLILVFVEVRLGGIELKKKQEIDVDVLILVFVEVRLGDNTIGTLSTH